MVNDLKEMQYVPTLPLKEKRKIVSIGAGGIVRGSHYPAYKLAGFEVVGVYDVKYDVAKKLAEDFNVPNVCETLEEIIELGVENNAIYDIAVPADKIVDILKFIPAESPVLIQKPMGENIEQATKILEICREKKLKAGLNFQMRHAPYIIAAKELIDSGAIGEIYDVEIQECVFTPWHLWDFLFKVERMEILYHSIHFIDVIRYILGKDPEGVYCKTMKHPEMMELAQTRSTVILDYGDLLRAEVHCNHGHKYGSEEQECYLKIEGSKGAIKLTIGVYLDYPVGKPDQFKYILLDDGKGWRELDIKGTWFSEAFIGPMGGLMRKLEDPNYNYINDIEDAYKTMLILEAAYESNNMGSHKVKY